MHHILTHRRTSRFTSALLTLAIGLTTLVVGATATAGAANAAPGDELLASDNPVNWTPKVLNGKVEAVRQVGNVVVVGGTFTQIQNTGSNQPIVNQANLFAFDAVTGRILPSFSPSVNAPVHAIVPSAAGNTVYVAGNFSQVNGVGASRVAELRVADGSRTAFRTPGINNEVNDIRLVGQRLFIAGAFSTVQQVSDPGMSVLDATTGDRLTGYDVPDFSGVAWDSASFTTVRKIDVTPDGSKLIAIGNFSAVGGQSRVQIAMLDLGPTAATVNGWSTTRFPGASSPGVSWCSRSFDTYMHDVDFAPDGSFFVVVTTGAYRADRLCDSASRFETDRTGPQVETWSDHTGGDTLWAVEVTGPVVYVGGHQRWLNNPYRADAAGPGAVSRPGIAALDSRNGLPFSWNPTRSRGVGLFDFDVTAAQVWAGSDTAKWAGESRPRLAGFPFDSDATPLPDDTVASLPADVVLLDSPAAGVAQTVHNFDGSDVLGSASPAAADDWSQARGAVMIDGTVYTGWANGTFRARSYDGTSFGAAQTLNLYANGYTTNTSTYTLFGTEIPRITGMFYDRANGRLYYTLRREGNDSGGFFYRYFTPESGIVGARRFTAVGGSLIGAEATGNSTPQGMFLADGKVYFADPNGVLKRIDFAPGVDGAAGGVTGTAVTVNSSVDWRSNAMFAATVGSGTGPNTLPTAQVDVTCQGMVCTADASASSDPDGSIASYAFDFGDGHSVPAGPDAVVQHTFETAGTYTVAVTVTDNRAGTDGASQSASPAPITSSINFRVSGKYAGGSKSTHTWNIPGGVVEGDQMVLAVSGSTAQTLTTPAGWAVLDQQIDTDLTTVIFGRVATAGDAGSAISFVWSGATRVSAVLAAYSGVSGAPAVVGAVESTSRAAHTTPAVNVPADGAWVLSYWADKGTATTDWAAPAGQTVRETVVDPALVGTTTTRVTGLFTDDGAAAASGARAGLTATADAAFGKATMFTIVLSPTP